MSYELRAKFPRISTYLRLHTPIGKRSHECDGRAMEAMFFYGVHRLMSFRIMVIRDSDGVGAVHCRAIE